MWAAAWRGRTKPPRSASPIDPRAESMPSSETIPCPFCTAEIEAHAKKCRHCAEWVARSCEGCGTPLRGEWAARGTCAECQRLNTLIAPDEHRAVVQRKSRGVAALSAIFLGGVGAHRFYLGNWLAGLVYLVFCWTLIPFFAGLFEGIKLALMDDAEFHRRYSQ